MPHQIINLEARGLLPLGQLPKFSERRFFIIVVDRAGREFDAELFYDRLIVKQEPGSFGHEDLIGWKMRA